VERWGDELWRAGFRPVSLAGSPAAQAKLLLGMYPWKGYTLVEEDACLTASAWEPAAATAAPRKPWSSVEGGDGADGGDGGGADGGIPAVQHDLIMANW